MLSLQSTGNHIHKKDAANEVVKNTAPAAVAGYLPQPEQLAVAVVIPTYNHALFLPEAIESVLAQTHSNVEILIVDDGSTDHTRDVVQRYPDVRYKYQQNRGLAAARNTGIEETSADHLIFLDADDRLRPNAVAVGLRYLAAHPDCAFVSGRYAFISKDGSSLPTRTQRRVLQDHYRVLLQDNYIGMHATVMYRRAHLLSVGGFNEALPACEDYDLYLRLTHNFPVHCHETVVAEYRQHGANMSANTLLMLKTVQEVLRAQQEIALSDEHRLALRRGFENWQNYYGAILATQIVSDGKNLRLLSAAWSAFQLARHAPHFLRQRFVDGLKWRIFMPLLSHTPVPIKRLAARWRRVEFTPPPGSIQFGDLYRINPVSNQFGFDRGLPIDRYYIEKFLAAHRSWIQGRVLEVGDREYTTRYGGKRVIVSDVLHVDFQNPLATIVADLASADNIPDDHFDCIILTQTLHLIYNVEEALHTLHRILKPGGVLLATVPGITQMSNDEWADAWYWAFTTLSIEKLLATAFVNGEKEINACGNVLAAMAFLQGIATEELHQADLDIVDKQYQLLITIFAKKHDPSDSPASTEIV